MALNFSIVTGWILLSYRLLAAAFPTIASSKEIETHSACNLPRLENNLSRFSRLVAQDQVLRGVPYTAHTQIMDISHRPGRLLLPVL